MKRLRWLFCAGLLAALPGGAPAQALVGDGLQGAYYDGRDFGTRVLTRRDATIDFDWHNENPVPGLPPADFSVRWTGWLVPPVSGHYVLHLTVDDGMRVWLDGRQLLNEWRGQSLSFYTVPLDLKAGQAYALRIDYCQYAWSTRALLAWERPDQPAPAASGRNLWGAMQDEVPPAVIPARYLFSRNPVPTVVPVPNVVVPAPKRTPETALAQRVAAVPVRRARPRPAPRAAPRETGNLAAVATQLAAGKAVTLRALYFEQGKAYLPAPVQATLDTLATALARRPSLRLEVQGHTDNQGDSTLNYQLSRRRAEAVCQYLAAHGVAADRLRAVGYGGRQPVADNNQPALRPRNRRVVLQPLVHK
ncbi:PA14 domain-containing protein [Hymenobacter sp. H14-R3]|uniref:PA14 domain-containing protein n=1 Tax=Hymenobacter sp. H14-R3 TaxID=3046308 RepID=UPI0024B8F100|nr:PA14 domain-containing protein [Hymenobacter sp. H14-R3]MDJ0367520.1 PA14 domain-containing protein [Hymenobacter sp. H14-R3]